MRRHALAAAVALLVVATPVALLLTRPASAGAGTVTVELGIDHSRFSTSEVTVHEGDTVRFVVTNGDPILHELIVGPPDVHQRHEAGTEAAHPPRPGEVTIQPNAAATTDYTFDTIGDIEFACHLPAHHAYGMTGEVHVVP